MNNIYWITESNTDSPFLCQGVEVACVPTGVKYLHHRALEFDVGVYFEANGHGTVIFSKKAMEAVKAATEDAT